MRRPRLSGASLTPSSSENSPLDGSIRHHSLARTRTDRSCSTAAQGPSFWAQRFPIEHVEQFVYNASYDIDSLGARDRMETTDFGSVRLLTFNRPDQLNAVDEILALSLIEALTTAGADDNIAAVVLTGQGRAFCAGVDLSYLQRMSTAEADSKPMLDFTDSIRCFEKPLIVAVNGLAVGIGTTLCLHADLVIAGASARFRTPFSAIGVAPEVGSSWLLPQQVGFQFASWMLLSAAWVEPDEALTRGLIFDIAPDDQLQSTAIAAATTIAANDPAALRAAKRLLRTWQAAPVDAAMAAENVEFAKLLVARSSTE